LIALLDVNVLVALFDPAHVQHESAHRWFARHRGEGWATCPLTENGCARILANPGYPGNWTTLEDAIARLARFRTSGDHHFWEDSISLCDDARLAWRESAGWRQLTDLYLLALAHARGGRLATFDRDIPRAAVRGVERDNLVVIAD
jgi:toxin-antitoxin system PIN domain toxin